MPGGRIDIGEKGDDAFLRELQEETGIKDFDNLGVIDYEIWHTDTGVPVCGIVNLVEMNHDEIELSNEHGNMKWISRKEIENYKYVWPKMARMIKKGFVK